MSILTYIKLQAMPIDHSVKIVIGQNPQLKEDIETGLSENLNIKTVLNILPASHLWQLLPVQIKNVNKKKVPRTSTIIMFLELIDYKYAVWTKVY